MRKASLVQTAIWETDFTTLSGQAKLVYLMLITQPTIMTTGMLAMSERRWRRYAGDDLEASLDELSLRRFVWVDDDQEELVVRSWVKHNVVGNSKMVKAARDQFRAITSARLRGLLVAEYPDVFDGLADPPPIPDTTNQDRASDTASEKGYPIGHSDRASIGDTVSTWSEERGTRSVASGHDQSTLPPKGQPTPSSTPALELVYAADHQEINAKDIGSDTRFAIEHLLTALTDQDDGTIGRLVTLARKGAGPADFHDARQAVTTTTPRSPSRVACTTIENRLATRSTA